MLAVLLLVGATLAQPAKPATCPQAEPLGISLEKTDGFPKELTSEVRAKTVDELLATIWLRYVDPKFGGKDWEKVTASYKAKALEAKNERAFYDALRGLVAELDGGESAFVSSTQIAASQASASPTFTGVGMLVMQSAAREGLTVQWVVPGGPADQAGLRPRDLILAVNGQPCPSTDKIRGPAGTNVTLTVKSPGKPPREITIQRGRINFPSSLVEARRLEADPSVGYVWIGALTGDDFPNVFSKALASIASGNNAVKSLILDLRSGSGAGIGLMEVVMGHFMGGARYSLEGPEVTVRRTIQPRTPNLDQMPLVVLVDQDTSGSATMAAAILQKRPKTVVIGQTTKTGGKLFRTHELPDGSALLLAEAKLVLADGGSLKDDRVTPAVTIGQDWTQSPEAEDPYLKAALEALGRLR